VENKVVARFADGRMIKGTTLNFLAGKEVFHVIDASAPAGAHPVEVRTQDLKALFFVKDLAGNPQRQKLSPAAPPRPAVGRRTKVVFNDGEVMVGTTTVHHPEGPGFFLHPEDSTLNEERCYVVTRAVRQIILL
jgi:hypothetical protein